MFTLANLLVAAHVPTYTGCVDNCCRPPRHHDTSQVIYLRGTGGLEVHLEGLGKRTFDFDAVFRDEVDPSTYQLFVGCGGCMPSDAILAPPSNITYLPAEVEPFTQTAYRSVFPTKQRTFDASDCADHFTVRLVQHANASEIVWGAVVGLGESFTARELFEFPLYILRNHGDVWNELGYTYWVWLSFTIVAVLVAVKPYTARDLLLALATVGFVSAGLEEFTHLCYAQTGAPLGYGFWVGLILVIGVAQGAGLLVIWGVRRTHRLVWIPLELSGAVGLLFLLGSGFYLGPITLMLASLARLIPVIGRARLPKEQPATKVVARRRFESV